MAELLKLEQHMAGPQGRGGVSIIIPTLNGAPWLERLLTMLDCQTVRADEILIVDSGSTDGSLEIIRAHGARLLEIPKEQFDHGGTRAMAIGKTFRFDRIAGHSWKQFAADMNVRPERLYSLREKLHESVMPAVEPLVAQHEGQDGASPVYERLVRIVRDGLNRLMRVTEESSKP